MNRSTSLVLAASLLASTAAFAQNYPEGSYPPVQVTSQAQRADVAAEAVRWNQAGQPGLVAGEGRPPFTTVAAAASDRAQVKADREQWIRSGLEGLNRGEATPDFGSVEYRAAVDRYEAAIGSTMASAVPVTGVATYAGSNRGVVSTIR